MEDFNQIHNKIHTLIQKYNGDTMTISQLNIIDNYAKQQEEYYNYIPDNIKTKNTLKYIIERILFRINQIEFKKNPKIIINVPIYTTDDIITDNNYELFKNKYEPFKNKYKKIRNNYEEIISNLTESRDKALDMIEKLKAENEKLLKRVNLQDDTLKKLMENIKKRT